jgi:hypothetical protein
VTTIVAALPEPDGFWEFSSFVLRILSVIAVKLGIFLYPLMSFSSLSTMGAGMPSGGIDPVAEASRVADKAPDARDRSDAVGDTGRVEGGLTAVESPEWAVPVVRLDALESERRILVASLGRLKEDVDVGAFGLILEMASKSDTVESNGTNISVRWAELEMIGRTCLAASWVRDGKRAPGPGRGNGRVALGSLFESVTEIEGDSLFVDMVVEAVYTVEKTNLWFSWRRWRERYGAQRISRNSQQAYKYSLV